MARNSFKVDKSLSLRPQTTVPTTEVTNGDLYYDSSLDAMRARIKNEWVDIGTGGLSLEEITTGASLVKGKHYLALTAGETHTLPAGEEGAQVWISVAKDVDVESSPIVITCNGSDTLEGSIETDLELDINDTWVLFSWNVSSGYWEIDDAFTPGISNADTQIYTIEDTATNIDGGFPYTHSLGSIPQDLELWVEESTGKWAKHDSATYILSSSTQLESSGTTLASVVGGSVNIKIIASAGPNTAGLQDASATQSGIVNISAQTIAGVKTFIDDTIFSSTGAVKLPVGTELERPASPVAGQIRYNDDTDTFEGYTTGWGSLGGGGLIIIPKTHATVDDDDLVDGYHYIVDMRSATADVVAELPSVAVESNIAVTVLSHTVYKLTINAASADKIFFDGTQYDSIDIPPMSVSGQAAWLELLGKDDTDWVVKDATTNLAGTFSGSLEVTGDLAVDNIAESTADAGVTIEGVTLKDSGISFGNEYLSAYDEGTWTPSYGSSGNLLDQAGGSLSNADITWGTATYTRIGNRVFAYLDLIEGLEINNINTGTFLIVYLTGLPAMNANSKIFGGGAGYIDTNPYERISLGLNRSANSLAINFQSHSPVINNDHIRITGVYFSYYV